MRKVYVTIILAVGISLIIASCSHSSDDSTAATATTAPKLDVSLVLLPSSCDAKQEITQSISISLDAESKAGNIDLPTIKRCDLVAITTTWAESDTIQTEEVHLHGYDWKWDIDSSGIPRSFVFYADLSGQFEVELEGISLELFTLRVN